MRPSEFIRRVLLVSRIVVLHLGCFPTPRVVVEETLIFNGGPGVFTRRPFLPASSASLVVLLVVRTLVGLEGEVSLVDDSDLLRPLEQKLRWLTSFEVYAHTYALPARQGLDMTQHPGEDAGGVQEGRLGRLNSVTPLAAKTSSDDLEKRRVRYVDVEMSLAVVGLALREERVQVKAVEDVSLRMIHQTSEVKHELREPRLLKLRAVRKRTSLDVSLHQCAVRIVRNQDAARFSLKKLQPINDDRLISSDGSLKSPAYGAKLLLRRRPRVLG